MTPGLKSAVQPGRYMGDDVGRVRRRAGHLDQEREHGHPASELGRANVAGVGVAEAGDDVGELGVERVVGQLVELGAQDPEPLDGIEAVAGALQRQVGEDTVQAPSRCRRSAAVARPE